MQRLKNYLNRSEPFDFNYCFECDGGFGTHRILLVHRRMMHSEASDLECPICQETCFEKELLQIHLYLQHGQLENSDYACVRKKSNLSYSSNSNSGADSGHESCETCGDSRQSM